MRYILLALLPGCWTEIGMTDQCEIVGKYHLCHQELSNIEAHDWCSDMDRILVNVLLEDDSVNQDEMKEVYLVGNAEFNDEPFWIDGLYECTMLAGTLMYEEDCRTEMPFICEYYDEP